MRLACLIVAGIVWLAPLPAAADPEPFSGNRNVRFEVNFNFFTRSPNSIVASGDIEDTGTIGHDTNEFFRGDVAKVIDTPQFTKGNITWELNNVYTPSESGPMTNGDKKTVQSWRILGGTGKYEGISGHGNSQGLWNGINGTIHVVGYGVVDCPKC